MLNSTQGSNFTMKDLSFIHFLLKMRLAHLKSQKEASADPREIGISELQMEDIEALIEKLFDHKYCKPDLMADIITTSNISQS